MLNNLDYTGKIKRIDGDEIIVKLNNRSILKGFRQFMRASQEIDRQM